MKEGYLRSFIPAPEEFAAAFGVGSDASSISAIDACGVILAALKSVHRQSGEREKALSALRCELDDVRALLEKLEAQQNMEEESGSE